MYKWSPNSHVHDHESATSQDVAIIVASIVQNCPAITSLKNNWCNFILSRLILISFDTVQIKLEKIQNVFDF